ncbi:MAG: PilX N-terminal domain-containing pilus assembly protein [Pseudomonas sp.]
MKPHIYQPHGPAPQQQKGAVLVLSLVLLLILTTLAVTNMREVALESRTTGSLVNERTCYDAAEAGLRDAQYSITGALTDKTPGNYRLRPISFYGDFASVSPPNAYESCDDAPADQPCILDIETKDVPFAQGFRPDEPEYKGVKKYSPDDVTEFEPEIVWYAIHVNELADEAAAFVSESGAMLAGEGEFRYEINASASDGRCRADLRSTSMRVFL